MICISLSNSKDHNIYLCQISKHGCYRQHIRVYDTVMLHLPAANEYSTGQDKMKLLVTELQDLRNSYTGCVY